MVGALVRKHGLSFTHNPGGGGFYWSSGSSTPSVAFADRRCQIHMGDDVEDYETVLAWLQRIGLEEGAK
jgi:hypothetical protein